ncbi:hypothetical protein [Dapis sp. BLCC M229]|uniref:hypothetical protein n=1 Tax=Dapis sp. BLCC M229 TaxID=3400188 RepID=UPI003CF84BE5
MQCWSRKLALVEQFIALGHELGIAIIINFVYFASAKLLLISEVNLSDFLLVNLRKYCEL